MIKFTIITLFPEALAPYLGTSMMWKATDKGLAQFEFVNLREYGLGPHKSVDDTPYGGGDGMLLRCEPVFAAVESVKAHASEAEVILPTPVGAIWNQALAREFAGVGDGGKSANETSGGVATANGQGVSDNMIGGRATGEIVTSNQAGRAPRDRHYIILCPHYEGYDERILSLVDYKVSLGRFVLTGGELAALVIIDSVVRLIPGVLGGAQSAEIESFSDGDNLEYPQYTKPAEFRGMRVPDVLLSGNHGEIAKWRAAHSGQAK